MAMNGGSFHIWFERSGGFAGMSTSVEISSDTLSANDLKELSELIDQSNFFEFQQAGDSKNFPDQFQYKITIEKEGDKRTVEFGDASMPEKFRPLVDYLTRMARRK